MPPFSRRRFLMLATLAPVSEVGAQLIGNGGGWSIRGTDPIELFHGERRVASYRSGGEAGLPLIDPVVGPTGGLYTAAMEKGEATGLFFALGDANGFDFRSGSASGRPPGRILHKGMNGVLIKGPVIAIRTKSEWLDAADETKRICSDRRELSFTYREDGSLVIDFALELAADAGDLALGVETEGAWSIRLAPGLAWKGGGESSALRNAEGLADAAVSGARSNWVACQGKEAKGEAAGVALFDHPANPDHPAAWTFGEGGLVSANPFGEGSDAPRLVPNGESLFFRYRAIFFKGGIDGIDPAKAWEAFAAR